MQTILVTTIRGRKVSLFLVFGILEMPVITRIAKSEMTKVSLSIFKIIDIAKLPAPDVLLVRVKYTASVFSRGNISASIAMPLMQKISRKRSNMQQM